MSQLISAVIRKTQFCVGTALRKIQKISAVMKKIAYLSFNMGYINS